MIYFIQTTKFKQKVCLSYTTCKLVNVCAFTYIKMETEILNQEIKNIAL